MLILLYFTCSFKTLQYLGVKTFPARDMKRYRKKLRNYSGFLKGLMHELHGDFSVCEKNTFKWLVAWQRSLPRLKFFFENLLWG